MSAKIITYQPKALIVEDWSGLQMTHFKPRGVWYSPVEGEVPAWRRWCEGEGWSPGSYTHKYRLHNIPYCSLAQALKGTGQGKVLLLSTEEDVLEFSTRFRDKGVDNIDWAAVARLVEGIEINPYQYGLKWNSHTSSWYGWWDISCGCVWRMPEGMELEQVPLDWDGSVETRSWGSFTNYD